MKNKGNKFIILLLIYLMFFGTLAGVLFSNKDITSSNQGKIILSIVLLGLSLIYWVVFYILSRRRKQKGN